jgi:NADPH-dependent 2,4-dienoyl-CoA reductase/sulfur reductase-like enzyme
MTGSSVAPIAVVGASHAGLTAAQTLLKSGVADTVTIFGAEPHRPYDRPPLSKEYLRGAWEADRCALADVSDPRVEWQTGVEVVGLDLAGPSVTLPGGVTRAFPGGVVIATGATPRTLPGGDLLGVHVLRTLDDARGLRLDLERQPGHVVIAGGGFIGAEVAAACVERGVQVTVLEAQDAPFERVLGAEAGEAVMSAHRARGVRVLTGAVVSALHGAVHIESVELADGTHLLADVVVVGLGVVPATTWLSGSGLALNGGVECDSTLLAAPRVVAAGDVARWPNRRFGEFRRVEHWDNAIRQGRHAALRLLAENGHGPIADFETVPWVWSDQYDIKLQVVGSTVDYDEVVIAHGSTDEQRFVALYRRGDHLTAAFGMNQAKLVTRYRRLLSSPVTWLEAMEQIGATNARASVR